MTTYYNFTPSATQIFSFQPTLDGQIYTIQVPWLLWRRNYYISCYSLANTLLFSEPLVGSPTGLTLQGLTWSLGVATATTIAPHGIAIGTTVALTLAGNLPDAYNGRWISLVTGPSTFTYALANDPGPVSALGSANQNINLLAGYFDTSTMVYRTANAQFEVT